MLIQMTVKHWICLDSLGPPAQRSSPLIGQEWSRDLGTGLWLVHLRSSASWHSTRVGSETRNFYINCVNTRGKTQGTECSLFCLDSLLYELTNCLITATWWVLTDCSKCKRHLFLTRKYAGRNKQCRTMPLTHHSGGSLLQQDKTNKDAHLADFMSVCV